MPEAAAVDRRGRDECGTASELRYAIEFGDREIGITQRDVRRGEKPRPLSGDEVEGPAIVRAAKCVGENWIIEFAFPDDSEARVDDLKLDSLGVEKTYSCVHVL